MHTFRNLDDAQDEHEAGGGWLLDLGGQTYMVTDDEAIVRDLRGADFIDRCEQLQCWDETELP